MAKKKDKKTEKMSKLDDLSPKRRVFVKEYIKDHNGTQAAIRAGYSKKTAQEQSSKMLSIPIVAEAVAELEDYHTRKSALTVDKILEGYGQIAFTNLPGIVNYGKGEMSLTDFESLSDAQRACLKKVKVTTSTKMIDGELTPVDRVEVELHDKLHALDKLGQYFHMFKDEHDVNVTNGTKLAEAREMFRSMSYEEKVEWLKKQNG